MHQAVTPAEGVPETCFFGVTPAVQHIPIVRLPSMTPMQGLMSPVRHSVGIGLQCISGLRVEVLGHEGFPTTLHLNIHLASAGRHFGVSEQQPGLLVKQSAEAGRHAHMRIVKPCLVAD